MCSWNPLVHFHVAEVVHLEKTSSSNKLGVEVRPRDVIVRFLDAVPDVQAVELVAEDLFALPVLRIAVDVVPVELVDVVSPPVRPFANRS